MGNVIRTSATETTMSYAFDARSLVKRFRKMTALAVVDLAAGPGGVLGLPGLNGAGKRRLNLRPTLTDGTVSLRVADPALSPQNPLIPGLALLLVAG